MANLEQKILDHFASYQGKECRYDNGMDWIEKVYVSGSSYGGYKILAELKYAGAVPVSEIEIEE